MLDYEVEIVSVTGRKIIFSTLISDPLINLLIANSILWWKVSHVLKWIYISVIQYNITQ